MIARAGLTLAVALVVASGAMPAKDAMAQENGVVEADQSSPVATAKSDLDQSAVVVETVHQAPRPTLASTRGAVMPKILGSYR